MVSTTYQCTHTSWQGGGAGTPQPMQQPMPPSNAVNGTATAAAAAAAAAGAIPVVASAAARLSTLHTGQVHLHLLSDDAAPKAVACADAMVSIGVN